MGIRADLRTYLAANAGISALVGTRIYWVAVDHTKNAGADCIAYAMSGSTEGHKLATGTAGYDDRIVEIASRSKDADAAEDIADAVRAALKGYQGSAGSSTFLSVTLLGESDGYDKSEDGSYVGQYVITQTYFIKRTETL